MIPPRELPESLVEEIKRHHFTHSEFEAIILIAILQRNKGLRKKTAKQLQIERRRFNHRLRHAQALGFPVLPAFRGGEYKRVLEMQTFEEWEK